MEWELSNGKLVKTFIFESQYELAQFLLKVAQYADEINHHPDCKIFKAFQLEITLCSHDKKEITNLDHQLSKKIDELFN